jgi:hypothetical protein
LGWFYNSEDHTTVLKAKDKIKGFLDHRFTTPEKLFINDFLCKYGYKEMEKPVPQEQKALRHRYTLLNKRRIYEKGMNCESCLPASILIIKLSNYK